MATPVRKKKRNQEAFDVSPAQAAQIQKANASRVYVQGFPVTFQPSGAITPLKIALSSSGRKLLGITILPQGTVTLRDTVVDFVVNNNNLLLQVGAQQLDPTLVADMIYFPLPQNLIGNDTIQLKGTNNNVAAAPAIVHVFYIPRLK